MTARLVLLFLTFATLAAAERPRWAIALHGGAGSLPRDLPAERQEAYVRSLEAARAAGVEVLEAGGAAVDAVEAAVRVMEDDPIFNAGRGAVLDASGRCRLDASVMRGDTLAGGAVASVGTVRHPITAARRVMEGTPHVLLVGAGAEDFALTAGCEQVEPGWLVTPRRWAALERTLTRRGEPLPERPAGLVLEPPDGEEVGGTVGCVALDAEGHLAAATSTGGLGGKMPGRVGDSPVLGAGTYADDRGAAVSGTGKGEQYIRHAVAFRVSQAVAAGTAIDDACRAVLEEVLDPGDGGLIALDREGRMSLRETTGAMPRAWATAGGEAATAIWSE